MQASEAASTQNQIAFAFMTESEAIRPGAAARGADMDALADGIGGGGLLSLISFVAAAGAIVLALVASGAAEPLLLTALAFLAMLGVFLVFGFMAGHIRIGEWLLEDDVVMALADGLADGVLVTRRDGSPVYANKMLAEIVGRTASGELATLDAAFTGEAQASEALFRLTRAAERGETRREEFRVRGAGPGVSRLMRVVARPFAVEGSGRELGPLVLWTVTDTTEERARDAATYETLEGQLAHFDAAPVGLIAADQAGNIKHANTTLLRWLGLEPVAVSDRVLKLADIFSDGGADLLRSAADGLAREGQAIDLDARGDGGRFLPMRLFARRDASGGLLIAVVNRENDGADEIESGATDIRFARFFQSAPFGIATVAADGRIVSANTAFSRLILEGANGAGAIAMDALSRSAEPHMKSAIETGLKQVLTGRASAGPVEIVTGPQQEFARRVYMSPLARSGGAREAAILYALDATEQKALEAKFAQSSKMEAVGKLAGGIAHDFNNVLTAIIGFSDLLLQTQRPTDPAYKDIMNIRSSANRAAGLVAKLLAFSRRQTLQTEPLLLSEVLTDWAPLMKRSIGEKIDLKMPPARELWLVKADKTQLEHVILNLSVNARDAMPDGGTLSIRTRNITERDSQKLGYDGLAIGEYVAIEVEDTGSGMSADVMAKIFEPFFTTKGVGKGTGLGLATVYGFVKQSGGFVYPESTLGKGTTFHIYLPRYLPESDEEVAAPKEKKTEKLADLTGTGRVLLVEDEDVVRQFAVRALKRQGYEVLEASSGIEALEVMAKNEGRIDIVVSDVVMPEMDGPTLLKELRKKNPLLKIIFVSGYPHEAFETSLDKDETFAFLAKPFSLPQLAAKVKEQLAK